MKTTFKKSFSSPLKRFLLISIFSIFSLQSMAGPILSITIEWGRKSKDCRGLGVCHFKLSLEERLISGTVQATPRELIMNIRQDALTGYENAIQGGYFIMEEDFVVPDEVAKALGESPKIVMKAGKYMARRTASGYAVRFPIE